MATVFRIILYIRDEAAGLSVKEVTPRWLYGSHSPNHSNYSTINFSARTSRRNEKAGLEIGSHERKKRIIEQNENTQAQKQIFQPGSAVILSRDEDHNQEKKDLIRGPDAIVHMAPDFFIA